jgi:hypothetical protein
MEHRLGLTRPFACAFLVVCFVSTSCAEHSGDRTAGAPGTAGSMAGASGAGGAPADECPESEPEPGSACSPMMRLRCRYPGQCCDVTAACAARPEAPSGGTWIVDRRCPQTCPTEPPGPGSACDPCLHAPTCTHDLCGAGGDIVTARCNADQGMWEIESEECEPYPCAGATCAIDEVCIAGRCEDNPCVDQPLSCACAAFCPASLPRCSVRPREISCGGCETC